MGKSDDLRSFQNNADGFICSLLPGLAHPQVQYSPGMFIHIYLFISLLSRFDCFLGHLRLKVEKRVFNLLMCKKLHREKGKNLSHNGSFVGTKKM